MSASPPRSGGRVDFTVTVDGKRLGGAVAVDQIETRSAINRVPRARLVMFDGDAAAATFPLSEEDTFLPGAKVEIAVGWDGAQASVFAGVVARHRIDIEEDRGSKLVVDLADVAIKMTLARKSAVFEKVKDSDLISKLVQASGLQASVEATKVEHEQVVQHYATDWDLMVTRAQLNGFVVVVAGGKVTVGPPATGTEPEVAVAYGDGVIRLDAQLDAQSQYPQSAVKAYAWNPNEQKLEEKAAGSVDGGGPGDVPPEQLAKVFGVTALARQTGATETAAALADWSTAELLFSRLARVRGSVQFPGTAHVVAGGTIGLDGLGKRFNGSAYVSGVRHTIRSGGWTTTADFGVDPAWFAAAHADIAAPPAAGLLPAAPGLHTGVVTEVAKDPAGAHRVRVRLPLLHDAGKGVWARLAGAYASNGFGAVFYPEVGDEVVVGFMGDDPRFGVVLGSLYGKKLPPPYAPDEKNNKKAIVTRSRLEITFDDENEVIVVTTPAKQRVTLDDKQGTVEVADKNDNVVTLSDQGIALQSAKDVAITADGDVTITAKGALSVKADGAVAIDAKNVELKAQDRISASATGDVALDAKGSLGLSAARALTAEGLTIEHKAKTKFSAKGNALAELEASGVLVVKGAMVKIN